MSATPERRLGDEEMRMLAKRIRETKYSPYDQPDIAYRLHCEELAGVPSGKIFLKVFGCGVEAVIWIEDNQIFATDCLPDIAGVEMILNTQPGPNETRRYRLKFA
jgi:hypothetical protein